MEANNNTWQGRDKQSDSLFIPLETSYCFSLDKHLLYTLIYVTIIQPKLTHSEEKQTRDTTVLQAETSVHPAPI